MASQLDFLYLKYSPSHLITRHGDHIKKKRWWNISTFRRVSDTFLKDRYTHHQGFPSSASGKEPSCQCRRCKRSLGWDDLEESMATHSSILAWRISWTEKPGGLQSMVHRVGHNWSNLAFSTYPSPELMLIFCHVCFRFLSFERLSSNSASPAPEVTAFVKLQCALIVMVGGLDFEAAEPLRLAEMEGTYQKSWLSFLESLPKILIRA